MSCHTGEGGLGDQLEQAIYCHYVAALLDADAIVDGFHVSTHRGGEEFRDAAALLGLNLRLTEAGARSYFTAPPLSGTQFIGAVDAEGLHNEVLAGRKNLSCHVMYASDIRSCSGVDAWCDVRPVFDNFQLTYHKLRNNDARAGCVKLGLGFVERKPTPETVQISWHIRTGDICLRCNDMDYWKRIYSQLLSVPAIARSHAITFESHDRVEWLEKEPLFAGASYFHTNQSLLESVCRFITADVLISTGSSFGPFVASFLPPMQPILLEERRKEAKTVKEDRFVHHFFKPWESIHMEDGQVQMDPQLFATHVDSMLRDRFLDQEVYGGAQCAASPAG